MLKQTTALQTAPTFTGLYHDRLPTFLFTHKKKVARHHLSCKALRTNAATCFFSAKLGMSSKVTLRSTWHKRLSILENSNFTNSSSSFTHMYTINLHHSRSGRNARSGLSLAAPSRNTVQRRLGKTNTNSRRTIYMYICKLLNTEHTAYWF